MAEGPWRYRSRSKVVGRNTPSHASDHLCLIWKESIQKCRSYRADTECGTDGRTEWKQYTPNNFVVRGYKKIKGPAHMAEGGHHFRKAPNTHPLLQSRYHYEQYMQHIGHGVLGQFSGQEETHGSLDFPARDGGAAVMHRALRLARRASDRLLHFGRISWTLIAMVR